MVSCVSLSCYGLAWFALRCYSLVHFPQAIMVFCSLFFGLLLSCMFSLGCNGLVCFLWAVMVLFCCCCFF